MVVIFHLDLHLLAVREILCLTFCGNFMILGGALSTFGFCCEIGVTPGGRGNEACAIPGGPPGGRINLGGGIAVKSDRLRIRNKS